MNYCSHGAKIFSLFRLMLPKYTNASRHLVDMVSELVLDYLCNIHERLPYPPTVLLQDPLLKSLAPHQVKHAVLEPRK